MRFALLGNHPDGLAITAALLDTKRHHLAAYTGTIAADLLHNWSVDVPKVNDLEEVLADPQIEMVIVAGVEANRPAQLRRALQAERDVLCVHPAARTPEIAYEAGMIQKDTGHVLLPLLPEPLHPAIARLKTLLQPSEKEESGLGALRLLEMQRASEIADGDGGALLAPSFAGWDVLRALGGEVAEVSAFAAGDAVRAGETVLVSGRFERGGLFQLTLLPNQEGAACRFAILGTRGRAELFFPQDWIGPAFLTYRDETGELQEEAWNSWDPWSAMVLQVEAAVAQRGERQRAEGEVPPPSVPLAISWEDAIRCLELDDAARRSIERRRSSTLEYQEASEEVGFKGTMTLLGCALLWGLLVLLIGLAVLSQVLNASKTALSRFLPEGVEAATCVGVLFGVPLAVFLLLQLFRLVARRKTDDGPPT
jgi:predicted dehydrogenase